MAPLANCTPLANWNGLVPTARYGLEIRSRSSEFVGPRAGPRDPTYGAGDLIPTSWAAVGARTAQLVGKWWADFRGADARSIAILLSGGSGEKLVVV
jgi:hypothetical protein